MQFEKYFKEFLKDTYPGARSSPTLMVQMMGLPDIQPDTAIAGDQNGFSYHIDKYIILLYSIQIQSYIF